jgi:hypothetical protein
MIVNQLVSSLTLKVLVGVVLTAASLISISILFQDLHIYLGKFENGDLLQLFTFSFLLVSTGTGLFFVLGHKNVKPEAGLDHSPIAALLGSDFKVLGAKFIEGFVTGLAKEPTKSK